MKILLFGSTGFMGSHLKQAFLEADYAVADPRVEIRNLDDVRRAFEEAKPDAVVNATGKTGTPNVDWCETHVAETFSVNVGGSLNIATVADEHKVYMVQMASGCIYDGYPKDGYREDDPPNYFGSVYSRSRIASEIALKEFPNVLQLRVRIPILGKPHPKNLIDKMIKYPKMINRMNSCTVIEDFLPAAIQLIEKRATGPLNMTNSGAMDHVGIMTLYQQIVDPAYQINLMSDAEQKELCKRRSNCFLNTNRREKELGVHMSSLEESLKRVLTDYKKNLP